MEEFNHIFLPLWTYLFLSHADEYSHYGPTFFRNSPQTPDSSRTDKCIVAEHQGVETTPWVGLATREEVIKSITRRRMLPPRISSLWWFIAVHLFYTLACNKVKCATRKHTGIILCGKGERLHCWSNPWSLSLSAIYGELKVNKLFECIFYKTNRTW